MWRQPEQSMAALSPELMYAAMNPRCLTPSSRKVSHAPPMPCTAEQKLAILAAPVMQLARPHSS